jgi:hypothetical protein
MLLAVSVSTAHIEEEPQAICMHHFQVLSLLCGESPCLTTKQQNWQHTDTEALHFELHLQLAQLPNTLHFCEAALSLADAGFNLCLPSGRRVNNNTQILEARDMSRLTTRQLHSLQRLSTIVTNSSV